MERRASLAPSQVDLIGREFADSVFSEGEHITEDGVETAVSVISVAPTTPQVVNGARLGSGPGTFGSVRDLNAQIRGFIDGWDDSCHPFVWTKTADDMLAKATRSETSNTGTSPDLHRRSTNMEQIHSGPMAGRTVLITGGTGGIGRATALGLATMGAHLAITGRDRGRTEGAALEIRAAGGGQVDVFVADLSSQSEVRRLADEVLESLSRIDVLVNNVGGYWNTRHVTADGLERTFALNHLASFLLTNLLLDRLKQSAPARVVTVSSNAHAQGRIDFDDLQGERSYSGARAYDQSKLANVLFTYELARRLQATSVTANALHPGVVSTSFGAEDPGGVQRLFVPFMRPFMKAPAQGAATSIHLASAPDLEQMTGRYFANSKPKRSSGRSYDEAAAARLWQVSADLVGLTAAG